MAPEQGELQAPPGPACSWHAAPSSSRPHAVMMAAPGDAEQQTGQQTKLERQEQAREGLRRRRENGLPFVVT